MNNRSNNLFTNFGKAIAGIWSICLSEIRTVLSDTGVLIIVVAVPLLYPVLYSFIYYPEVVKELPVAVIDQSRSNESRKFIRALNATPEISISYYAIDMQDAMDQFKRRNIRGIINIPSDFEKNIASGKQTTVSGYADMEYFLYYKALYSAVGFVSIETGNQIQLKNLENSGLTTQQAETTIEPFKAEGNAMANMSGGFASYGIPAALILIVQQTLVLAIGMIAGTRKERKQSWLIVPSNNIWNGTFQHVFGQAAAYFMIYLVLCIYMLGIIPVWFGYPRAGGLHEIISLMIPFVLSSIFFGITLSSLFKNRESAMMLYVFISIPLLFLSGIVWPLSNFSPAWLAFRSVFPSSNAILGYIKINSIGAGISETRFEILNLWIQTGIYFVTALLVYGFRIRKELNNNIIRNNP